MFELKGNVKKIIKNDYDNELIIFSVLRGERIFKCRYNGFLPLLENDAISLKGHLVDNEVMLSEKPLVIIPSSTENIKNCILKGIKGKGISIGKAEKVYEELYRRHESPHRDSKIINYLNDLSDPIPQDFKFENLTKIQTIKLLSWWNKNISKRRLYLLGLFDSEIRKSYMTDNKLYQTLRENPFKVFSISLDKAKQINNFFGKKNNLKDTKAGEIARFIIDQTNSKGWLGCPEFIVSRKYPEFSLFKEYLEVEYDFVFSNELIYTYHSWKIEFETTERLNELIRFTVEQKIRESNLPSLTKGYEVFPEEKIELTDEQTKALEGSLSSFISVITGGAGCGKTTLIKQLIKNFKSNDEEFILTSFTGKAVLRIRESLGVDFYDIECQTLHRIIHRKKTGQPIPKFYNVIIDECSMISTELIWEFLTLFRHKFRLILIGDCNQLPPIGRGSFFTEIINSERVSIYYLTQNKRMKQMNNKLTILENANGLISENRDKKIPFEFKKDDGFYLIESGIEYCYKIIQAFQQKGIKSEDITVITPFNRNIDDIINVQQSVYLGDNKKKEFNNRVYYIGDRMMQTKNMYQDEFELMNGEEGYITGIDDQTFSVDYGNGKIISYLWAMAKEDTKKKKKDKEEEEEEERELYCSDIKHSFCKTVHKSQGSEYKFVIFYIPRNMSGFLNINLLYTGITRAKEKIWIVCDKDSLDLATIKYLPYRYERLSQRLKEMRQEDEEIIENTKKKKIEIENIDTVETNDDIWDYDMEDDVPQAILDYYD